MNANCYRLIFDKRTGMLIPVAEITPSAGKGRGRAKGADGSGGSPLWNSLYTAIAVAGLGFPIAGNAQTVVLDPAMGANASVTHAANGVPLVNVATPGSSGLSHTKFNEFNVGQQGLIFNNSLTDGVTDLGGHAMKNPHLARTANGILTEVTGTNISRIEGSLEIHGQKADLLIANPNGLYVNGVATINANSVVLTTGSPWNGGDRHFDVRGGKIEIGNINTDGLSHFDVVARSIKLHGAVVGDAEAKLAAGLNRYDARTRAVTKIADSGAGTPSLAIEGSAVGAMYGKHVQLISTESGVGVRHDGLVSAESDIHISASGDVTLRAVASGANTTIAGRDIALGGPDNEDELSSQVFGDLNMTASRDIDITGRHDLGRAALTAGGTLEAKDIRVQARSRGPNEPASLAMTATNIDLRNGLIQSADALALKSDKLTIAADANVLAGNLDANVTDTLENRGHMGAIQTLSVNAGTLKNHSVISAANLNLTLAHLENEAKGQLLAEKLLKVSLGDGVSINKGLIYTEEGPMTIAGALTRLVNNGLIQSFDSDMQVALSTLENNGEIAASAKATISAIVKLHNAGQIYAHDLAVTAAALANTGANAEIHADATAKLDVAGDFVNEKGASLTANRTIEVDADGNVTNDGASIGAGTHVDIDAGGNLVNRNGAGLEAAAVKLKAAGNIENIDAQVYGVSSVDIDAGNAFRNDNANLLTDGALTLDAGGDIANANGAWIDGASVAVSGGGKFENSGATIQGAGNVTIGVVGAATNRDAVIAAGGALTLAGASLANTEGGAIDARGNVRIDAKSGAIDNNHASIGGAGIAMSAAGAIANSAGTISGTQVALTAGGDIVNEKAGGIHADHDITLRAGRDVVNDASEILGYDAGKLHVKAGRDVINRNAGMVSGDALDIHAARELRNAGGSKVFGTTLAADAGGALHNQDADSILWAQDTLTLKGASLDNRDGAVISADSVHAEVSSGIANANGAGIEGVDVTLKAGTNISNTGGAEITADGSIAIDAGCNVENTGSTIKGFGQADIRIDAGCNVTNTSSSDISGDAIDIVAGGDVRNTGASIIVGNAIGIDATGAVENPGADSAIASSNTVNIAGASLDNHGKAVVQGRIVDIDLTGKLHNRDEDSAILAEHDLHIDAATLENTGKAVVQAGLDVKLDIGGDAINKGGARLEAGNVLEGKVGGSLTNENAGTAIVGGFVELDVQGEAWNRDQALMQASDALSLKAQRLTNRNAKLLAGEVAQDGTVWEGDMELVSRETITNDQGAQIVATGSAWIDANGNIRNDGAAISGKHLYVEAKGADSDITNTATGTIQAVGTVDLRAERDLTNAGTITGDEVTLISADDMANSGRIAGRNWIFGNTRWFDNAGTGVIEAGNTVELETFTYANTGSIRTDGVAILSILDDRDITFNAGAINPFAKDTLRVHARNILVERELQNAGHVHLYATGWIDNVDGIFSGRSIVADAANAWIANRSLIWAAGNVSLDADTITNHANAEIEAGVDLRIDAKAALTNSSTARIAAGRHAWIDAPLIRNHADHAGGAHVPGHGDGESAGHSATDEHLVFYAFWFNGLRKAESTLTYVNRGVIEAGGDLHVNRLTQADKGATLDNDGQVLAGGNLRLNGHVDNTGVVATMSIREFLQQPSTVHFAAQQGTNYQQRDYDSMWAALDEVFSSHKSWSFGFANWQWDTEEIARQMQQTAGSPLFQKAMTAIFGATWKTRNYADMIVQWNAYKAENDFPTMDFAADRGPELAAGGNIVQDTGSGSIRNGLSGQQKNNETVTVEIGGETVTTVDGNFETTLNLGDLTQALDPTDIWKHLTREGNKKFRLSPPPQERGDTDWTAKAPEPKLAQRGMDQGMERIDVVVSLDVATAAGPLVTKPVVPVHPLFETRIEFVDQDAFFGSDYFFGQVGYHTDRTVTVIGDNYFINELVTGQITRQVGTFLAVREQVTGAELVQRLMDNAGVEGARLGLRVGVAPTAEQLAGLTEDIVWFVEQDVNGHKALVPTVYLASTTVAAVQAQRQSGAATIAAGETVILSADEGGIDNNTGSIRAGRSLVLESKGEVRNSTRLGFKDGGLIAKDALVIDAKGDVTNEGGLISATDVNIKTDGNFTDRGLMGFDDKGALRLKQRGRIMGGGADSDTAPPTTQSEPQDAGVAAQLQVESAPEPVLTAGTTATDGEQSVAPEASAEAAPATRNASHRGSVSIKAKGDVTLTASDIAAQHIAISAGKDLVVKDVHEVTSDFEASSTFGLLGKSSYEKKTIEATSVGARLKGAREGGSLSLVAGNDILLQGGEYGADHGHIKAGGNFTTATAKDYKHVSEKTVTEGLVIEVRAGVGGSGVAAGIGADGAFAAVSADGVEEIAVAGGRPKIGGKTSGKQVLGETAGTKIGWERVETEEETLSVKNRNAQMNFGSGLTVTAGKTLDIGGVDMAAIKADGTTFGVISLEGGEIVSTKHEDIEKTSTRRKEQFAGLTSSVSSSLADVADNTKRLADKALKEGMEIDPGLTAVQAASDALKIATNDLIALSHDVGFRQNETSGTSATRSQNINSIVGNVALKSTKGDINLKGVEIGGEGATVTVDSARDFLLSSAETTTEFESRTETHSATVGGSASVAPTGAGLGISAGYKGTLESSKGKGTQHYNSSITGGNISIKAKNDFAMRGANVQGGNVDLDIGGNMRIESVQDTYNEKGDRIEFGASIGAAVTTNGIVQGTVSANGGYGENWDNRNKVAKQSGIKADGKLAANVGGDLHLKGAHMTSGTPGEVNVGGRITTETMRDKVDKDGNYAGGGGGMSRTGLPTINFQYEKSDREIYDATHNGTLAGVEINAKGGVHGAVNKDADKALVVHQDRKIAGNQMGLDLSLDDINDGVNKVRKRHSGSWTPDHNVGDGTPDGVYRQRRAPSGSDTPRAGDPQRPVDSVDGAPPRGLDTQEIRIDFDADDVVDASDIRIGIEKRSGATDRQDTETTVDAAPPLSMPGSDGPSRNTNGGSVAKPENGPKLRQPGGLNHRLSMPGGIPRADDRIAQIGDKFFVKDDNGNVTDRYAERNADGEFREMGRLSPEVRASLELNGKRPVKQPEAGGPHSSTITIGSTETIIRTEVGPGDGGNDLVASGKPDDRHVSIVDIGGDAPNEGPANPQTAGDTGHSSTVDIGSGEVVIRTEQGGDAGDGNGVATGGPDDRHVTNVNLGGEPPKDDTVGSHKPKEQAPPLDVETSLDATPPVSGDLPAHRESSDADSGLDSDSDGNTSRIDPGTEVRGDSDGDSGLNDDSISLDDIGLELPGDVNDGTTRDEAEPDSKFQTQVRVDTIVRTPIEKVGGTTPPKPAGKVGKDQPAQAAKVETPVSKADVDAETGENAPPVPPRNYTREDIEGPKDLASPPARGAKHEAAAADGNDGNSGTRKPDPDYVTLAEMAAQRNADRAGNPGDRMQGQQAASDAPSLPPRAGADAPSPKKKGLFKRVQDKLHPSKKKPKKVEISAPIGLDPNYTRDGRPLTSSDLITIDEARKLVGVNDASGNDGLPPGTDAPIKQESDYATVEDINLDWNSARPGRDADQPNRDRTQVEDPSIGGSDRVAANGADATDSPSLDRQIDPSTGEPLYDTPWDLDATVDGLEKTFSAMTPDRQEALKKAFDDDLGTSRTDDAAGANAKKYSDGEFEAVLAERREALKRQFETDHGDADLTTPAGVQAELRKVAAELEAWDRAFQRDAQEMEAGRGGSASWMTPSDDRMLQGHRSEIDRLVDRKAALELLANDMRQKDAGPTGTSAVRTQGQQAASEAPSLPPRVGADAPSSKKKDGLFKRMQDKLHPPKKTTKKVEISSPVGLDPNYSRDGRALTRSDFITIDEAKKLVGVDTDASVRGSDFANSDFMAMEDVQKVVRSDFASSDFMKIDDVMKAVESTRKTDDKKTSDGPRDDDPPPLPPRGQPKQDRTQAENLGSPAQRPGDVSTAKPRVEDAAGAKAKKYSDGEFEAVLAERREALKRKFETNDGAADLTTPAGVQAELRKVTAELDAWDRAFQRDAQEMEAGRGGSASWMTPSDDTMLQGHRAEIDRLVDQKAALELLASDMRQALEPKDYRELAESVFKSVRKDYEAGMKSTNKIYAYDRTRYRHIGAKIWHNRDRSAINHFTGTIAPPITRIDAANCGDLARCVTRRVWEKGGHTEVWRIEGHDHAFAVVGRPPGNADSSINFAGWKDVWIADPWANLLVEAPEYTEQLEKKMGKWKQDGKFIQYEREFGPPDNPKWIDGIRNGKKALAERPIEGGGNIWSYLTLSSGDQAGAGAKHGVGSAVAPHNGEKTNRPAVYHADQVIYQHGRAMVKVGKDKRFVEPRSDGTFVEVGSK